MKRQWKVRFASGQVILVKARDYKSARTAARIHDHSGIESIVLQESLSQKSKNRKLAIAAFKSKKNPSPRQEEEAENLLESFTGSRATKEARHRVPAMRTALEIGKLDGVMYTAVRDGVKERYFHKFAKNSRPLLVSSHDGNSLGIVGGRYKFTDAGIEDR